MLWWILLGLLVGIVALASLSDYIWKERMKPPARVVCRLCALGNSSVKVSGFWIHQFQDRWISCPAYIHPQTEVVNVTVSVTEPAAGAWQSDEQLAAIGQQP
jgi:hypothetical protein